MQEIVKNKELQKEMAKGLHDMMLQRLRDIDGLDEVSWWPPSLGVSLIIILAFLLLIISVILYLKKRAWNLSWKGEIFRRLDQMQYNVEQNNARDFAIELSEILRRIAMHKYSREDCASLIGNKWLVWLQKHDPAGFNWPKYGVILTKDVFASRDKNFDISSLVKLILATKNWVK